MKLYFMRHGIAIPRAEDTPDFSRPLTPEGIAKTTRVAQRLKEININFDLVLTSPLTRAQQTAKILQQEGLTQQVDELSALVPGGKLADFSYWLTNCPKKYDALALVGHQPDLASWAETIVWGKYQEKIILKKAGIIGIQLADYVSLIGQGELFLLTSPKWFI